MTDKPTLLSVYDGQHIRGFVLARGKAGYEVFTANQVSLGLFRTATDAADEISAACSSKPRGS
jgi:hypothetical protein